MKTITVKLLRSVALGRGTRRQGAVLAEVRGPVEFDHHALAGAAWDAEDLTNDFTPDGVTVELGSETDARGETEEITFRELATALRSPNVEFVESIEPDPAGDDEPETVKKRPVKKRPANTQ